MSKQTRLTVKGQVTIPKDVRDALGLRPGDNVAFDKKDGRIVVRKGDDLPEEIFSQRLERARALANPLPLGMTTDEYMTLIREPVPLPNPE